MLHYFFGNVLHNRREFFMDLELYVFEVYQEGLAWNIIRSDAGRRILIELKTPRSAEKMAATCVEFAAGGFSFENCRR